MLIKLIKIRRTETYIKELFLDEHRDNSINIPNEEELLLALRRMKADKAPVADEVHVELIELLEEQHLEPILDLFNGIYVTGELPKVWLISTFIPIPKSRLKDTMNTV